MNYQQCKRCVMDNASDKTISFNDKGYCNYCEDIKKRMKFAYFPSAEGTRRLEAMISEMKETSKNDEYECLVGISGGIDSSYILYYGFKKGLRMLAVHIDDGLDNPVAVNNINKLVNATGARVINISPDRKEYADILYSLFKASVSNLAIAQDNLIAKALQDYADQNGIKYMLDGSNFAHESILERGKAVNPADKKFILSIQKKFGRTTIKNIEFMSLWDRYIARHSSKKVKHIRPLNYMDYQVQKAIRELEDFCGFEYYGGKHYESILTRFMQCYYLPVKFGVDKRKSHYSSLIMSGQMSREEAIRRLKEPFYPNDDMLNADMNFLAKYMNISDEELKECLDRPPVEMTSYPHSILNNLAPIARKLRKLLE